MRFRLALASLFVFSSLASAADPADQPPLQLARLFSEFVSAERLKTLGDAPAPEALAAIMSPKEKGAARTKLVELEARLPESANHKEFARGFQLLDGGRVNPPANPQDVKGDQAPERHLMETPKVAGTRLNLHDPFEAIAANDGDGEVGVERLPQRDFAPTGRVDPASRAKSHAAVEELHVSQGPDGPPHSDGPAEGGLPTWPVGAALGVLTYSVARSRRAWSEQESEQPAYEDSNSERIQENRYKLKVAAAAAAIGFGIAYGGPILLRAAAPAATTLWRGAGGSFQRVAASEAGAINPGTTGTVWDSIRATGASWPGTQIPRSFEVSVRAGRFWVHPNATEHMWEFIGKVKSPERMVSRPPIQSQVILDSFRAALDQATAQGIQYGQRVSAGQWEIMISRRATDALPVVMHAKYKH